MKWFSSFLIVLFLIGISACTSGITPSATNTPQPSNTSQPTTTPTIKPSPTPTLIQYVTLGSPFASDCGDGIPRIWSNDSFNGPFKNAFDDHHGHVDIFVPKGCNVNDFSGEVKSSVSGFMEIYGEGLGYMITLPSGIYIKGIENAMEYAGIDKPDLSLISKIDIAYGHIKSFSNIDHEIVKGESIGDIVPCCKQQKLGYQIQIYYDGVEYMFSPTLFEQDDPKWICVPNSPYDCIAEPQDYIK